jgi:hypothetical protein
MELQRRAEKKDASCRAGLGRRWTDDGTTKHKQLVSGVLFVFAVLSSVICAKRGGRAVPSVQSVFLTSLT